MQDDWEVTDKRTLNPGLRWDYEENLSYVDYRVPDDLAAALRGWTNIQNADYDIADYIRTGCNRDNFKSAWQPRFGLSYALFGDQEHVISGGAGTPSYTNTYHTMVREYSYNRKIAVVGKREV